MCHIAIILTDIVIVIGYTISGKHYLQIIFILKFKTIKIMMLWYLFGSVLGGSEYSDIDDNSDIIKWNIDIVLIRHIW